MTHYLRDVRQRILGKIEDRGDGMKVARSVGGAFLGTYDPRTDTTRDTGGRIVGTGDLLSSLITEYNQR